MTSNNNKKYTTSITKTIYKKKKTNFTSIFDIKIVQMSSLVKLRHKMN